MNYYNQMGNGWTDVRVELLKKLQIDGLSASQIAAELGQITRNAIIGKLKRMGLGGKYARSRGQEIAPIFRKPRAPKPQKPRGEEINFVRRPTRKPEVHSSQKRAARQAAAAELREQFTCTEIVDLTLEQSATKCTLMQLNRHTCRWPLGNPQQEDFGFCGAEPYQDYPYCAQHCRVAYQIVSRETKVA